MKKYIDEEGHEVSVCDKYTEWRKNGELHQDGDKPALIISNLMGDLSGAKYWYKNGLLHRDGDKPAIVRSQQSKEWWQNGVRHRENNMAYFHLGLKYYCLNFAQRAEKEYWIRLLLMEY